jgi:uncharacterized protein YdhG (YjbR/CyaY superfamily)
VSQYVAAQPKEVRAVLARVRTILRKAMPGAEEVISYDMPTYKVGGKGALFFAGWKKHYSIYPASDAVLEAYGEELAAHEVSKRTLRFPLDAPVPAALLAGIAKLRAREVLADQKAKITKPRTAAKKRR